MLLRSTAFSLALFVFVVSFHDEEILDTRPWSRIDCHHSPKAKHTA